MWSTKFNLGFEGFEGMKQVRFSSSTIEVKSRRHADQEDGLME